MKRFKYIFGVILAVILTNLTTKVIAQESTGEQANDISAQNIRANEEATAWLDSVDIFLLTCGPGQEVWSYYGHTALRIQDKVHGTDVAVNWGMFSFKQSCFVLRFVFGLTDYQIGIFPMSDFLAEYASEDRWVKQQRIRLSREEKLNILRAIEENDKPENRTYRYNYFYDNCTTRAREMILDNIGANSTNFEDKPTVSSYREEIHKLNENHRWARFGNDLLLGYLADRPISQREWEFLPDNLSKDFETEGRTDFIGNTPVDGNSEATQTHGFITMIDSTSYLIPPRAQVVDDTSITPQEVFLAIAFIIIVVSIIEIYTKKNFWCMDAILFLLTGIPGLILLAMIFSQHPTVQLNFQILILNPLNLIFVWKTIKKMRKGKLYWYYEVWGILLLLALFLQIWQQYAEGMGILALSLLVRYTMKATLANLQSKRHTPSRYIKKQFRYQRRRQFRNINK